MPRNCQYVGACVYIYVCVCLCECFNSPRAALFISTTSTFGYWMPFCLADKVEGGGRSRRNVEGSGVYKAVHYAVKFTISCSFCAELTSNSTSATNAT